MLIDSHAHLDSERYADDREAMLARAAEAGVGAVLAIGIGEGPAQMHQALDICRQFNGQPGMPRLFASAGIYPHNTPEADEAALAKLDSLLAEPEVIACGEIGLDYYHEGAPHPVQREGLICQLEIAAARKRPILIHCRPKEGATDAWDDLFEVLDEHWRFNRPRRRHALFRRGIGSRRNVRSISASSSPSPATSPIPRPSRCATLPHACPSTACWSKPTPHGSLPRPIAASATSPPGSPEQPQPWRK